MTTRHSLIPFPFLVSDIEEIFDKFDKPSFFKASESGGVSVYEEEKSVIAEFHLPGISEEEVQITYHKGVLSIQAEKKEEKKEVKYHTKARASFSYRVVLPSQVDENATPDASFEKGILKVVFPKSQSSMPKKIQITRK